MQRKDIACSLLPCIMPIKKKEREKKTRDMIGLQYDKGLCIHDLFWEMFRKPSLSLWLTVISPNEIGVYHMYEHTAENENKTDPKAKSARFLPFWFSLKLF